MFSSVFQCGYRVNQNQHPSWTSADSLRGWPKPTSLTSCSSGASWALRSRPTWPTTCKEWTSKRSMGSSRTPWRCPAAASTRRWTPAWSRSPGGPRECVQGQGESQRVGASRWGFIFIWSGICHKDTIYLILAVFFGGGGVITMSCLSRRERYMSNSSWQTSLTWLEQTRLSNIEVRQWKRGLNITC